MFSSDFSHRLEDTGTNCMSNDTPDVQVLRGEPRFEKFSNLRILWSLFILVTRSVFAHFFNFEKNENGKSYFFAPKHLFGTNDMKTVIKIEKKSKVRIFWF